MSPLSAILPELLLSAGAIVLMIVAAFGGARVSRLNHAPRGRCFCLARPSP